ncbi:MAG: outer membrane beta-barrel protein [Pseudomonadota bacterium]
MLLSAVFAASGLTAPATAQVLLPNPSGNVVIEGDATVAGAENRRSQSADNGSIGAPLTIGVENGSDPAFDDGSNFDGTIPVDDPNQPTALTPSSDDASSGTGRAAAARRAQPVGEPGPDGQTTTRSNVAAAPIEGSVSQPDDDPYAPIGLRMGTFTLLPTIEQSLGVTSNADATSGGSESAFSQTDVSVEARSDWSRHEFLLQMQATYQKFLNGSTDDLPSAGGDATLRLDVNQDVTINFGLGYDFTNESASSSNLTNLTGVITRADGTVVGAAAAGPTVTNRPGVHAVEAFAEANRNAGKFGVSLRGTIIKTTYENADLSNGTSVSQGDRDNVLATGRIRLSYEHTPAIAPFVEVSYGKRTYDQRLDRNGNRRDGTNYALRGGVAYDFGEKLTGEIAAGYAAEKFDDAGLNTLSGVTVDGNIVWSPQRLTTVTATATTSLVPSTIANDSGSIRYSGTLNIARQFKPQLRIDAGVTASFEDFDGTGREDVVYGANTGFVWSLNRSAAITGRLSYEKSESSDPDSDFDTTTARVGLRLRK